MEPSSPGGLSLIAEEAGPCGDELLDRWGPEGLAAFSTTEAARDVAWMADALRRPGQEVQVHGGSYGSMWTQRVLHVGESSVDAASMMGLVPPGFSFTAYDAAYEDVGADYLSACAASLRCRQELGPDPWSAVADAWDGPACVDGLDRNALRRHAGGWLAFGGPERVLIPALARRAARCDAADRAALTHYVDNVPAPGSSLRTDPLFGRLINTHVIVSELWEPPWPTTAEADALLAEALFALGSSKRVVELADGWPANAQPAWADSLPATAVPLMMLNGSLDPATPLAGARAMEALDGPDQRFVVLDGASHAFSSPTVDGYDCGLNLLFGFFVEPTGAPLDCTALVLPHDFGDNAGIAAWAFGASSVWGG